jgi:hypothetical protein
VEIEQALLKDASKCPESCCISIDTSCLHIPFGTPEAVEVAHTHLTHQAPASFAPVATHSVAGRCFVYAVACRCADATNDGVPLAWHILLCFVLWCGGGRTDTELSAK